MKTAGASLPKSLYRREWLEAAAAGLSGAEVSVSASGARWAVRVTARARAAEKLGELLNAALARAARADRLAEDGDRVSAVAMRLLSEGFPPAPLDPLEQLEPQVRADRAEETAALLARAKEGR